MAIVTFTISAEVDNDLHEYTFPKQVLDEMEELINKDSFLFPYGLHDSNFDIDWEG